MRFSFFSRLLSHPSLCRRLAAAAALCAASLQTAPANPVRVLHLGANNSASADRVHHLMRELGRDAIWFDTTSDPAQANADWLKRFDIVLLDAPSQRFPDLSTVDSRRVVTPEFPNSGALSPETIASTRAQILQGLSPERRQAWVDFLAQREPERREKSDQIANYERRPAPITFQHPFSVNGSKQRTQVAPDLRLELFAADPDIGKPIAFAWDERGRCWVAETRDYPHDVQPSGEGRDRITICEDTDGDGRADKFTVFADRLNIPTSLVFARGGVVVAQPPRFLLLKDTNGDDRADTREVLLDGWGIGDTHAQANNLHWGLDNWLYGCVGYSGYKGTVGGREQEFRMGTFRFTSDGRALEFLHQFSNNSWAHSHNTYGDQFGGTANGAPIFYGGIPASAAPQGFRVISAKKINLEDKAHPITPNFRQVDVFGGYTAAAGSAFIESPNLPKRLQGLAMVCEPTLKLINLMDVRPQGAGYVARDGFNLVASTDEWMSPVFAEVGPDGAIWFADWQNFIIQHNPTPSVGRGGYDAQTGVGGAHVNPLRDSTRGRIYRVVWDKAARPTLASLHKSTPEQQVAALSDGNPFWRLTAQRLLVEGRADSTAPALRQLAANAASPAVAAIHALWTLHGLGKLDAATHQSALLSRNAALRRNAVRALGSDAASQSLFFGAGVISDPDLITRLAAFVKLAEFPTSPSIQTIVRSLASNPIHRGDEWLNEAIRLLSKRHQIQLFTEGPNLIANASLESLDASGLPEGWKRRDYGNRPANNSTTWESVAGPSNTHSGNRAVRAFSPNGEADSSLYADIPVKPNTQYRLSGWVKGKDLRGRLSFNDHLGRSETERVTRDGDWTEVETVFNSRNATVASINILFVARGQGWFDDVRLSELLPMADPKTTVTSSDAGRGKEIFYKHPAACILCHSLNGQGSTVGPALDGIASRKDASYLRESLLEPSKVLAQGYENFPQSPMPPMGDIFSAQELADIEAFLQTLKAKP